MLIQKINQTAKTKNFDKHIADSQNHNKYAWNIIKELTEKGAKNKFINLVHGRKKSSQIQQLDGSIMPTSPIFKCYESTFLHFVDEYKIMDITRHKSEKKLSDLIKYPVSYLMFLF